jgi:hypothetical protein
MKPIVSYICLLALLLSGCTQEEMLRNGTSASGEGRTFTTSFEKIESRTYLEDGLLTRWTAGDRLSLFDGNTVNSQYLFAGDTGDSGGTFFMLNKPEGTGSSLVTNYAVYPYSEDVAMTKEGEISVTLPTEQHYAENSYGLGDNTMVAVTEDTDDTFLKFKNVGGAIKLQLYGKDITVESITLMGNNKEKIAGTATITAAYDEAPTVSMADDATSSIMLDCGEKGVKIGASAEQATAFWMVVPPTVFEKGFTITVMDVNGGVFIQSTDKKVVIERNVVKPMAAIEAHVSYERDIPEELKDEGLATTIQVDGANAADFYKECYVSSIYDKAPISNEKIELQTNINKKVQTYFLTGENDEIYMMARVSDTEKNKGITFNADNTALAFVTFHPFFANIDSLAYDVLEEAILNSQNFPKLRTETSNVIRQKQDLYNEGNTALFDALDAVLEELLVPSDNPSGANTASRAITNETGYAPFRINSNGDRLDIQVLGLRPNYYGTATHANGSKKELKVPSHDDIGFLFGIKNFADIITQKGWYESHYGKAVSYTYPAEGECQFHFSCKTEENEVDMAMSILNSCLDMVGASISDVWSTKIRNTLKSIASNKAGKAMAYFPYFSATRYGASGDLMELGSALLQSMIDLAFDIEIEACRQKKIEWGWNSRMNKYYAQSLHNLKKAKALYSKVMFRYTMAKGLINIGTRYVAAQLAPEIVDFKFCCYDNEIRNCSQIRKLAGDNQSGYYEAELDEPISVMINVTAGSLSDYVVKFEVAKGGGSVGEDKKKVEYIELGNFDYTVSTKWTMGSESAEQIVKACLCDKETKEEVCEPVEFKATAQPPLLSIDIDEKYDELPYYKEGMVTFNPTIHVTTPETDKIDKLYDWGIILYEHGAGEELKEIKRMSIGTDSYEFDFTHEFTLAKSEMKLDYTTYIAKNDEKYSVCAYVVYEEGGKPVESEVTNNIRLVYDRKPSFTLSNLSYQTVPYNDGVHHYKTTYLFDVLTTGALWMDNFYRVSYMFGKDVYQVAPRDAVAHANYGFLFSYSNNTLESIDYIGATVNGTEVKSKNFIYMFTYKSQCDMVLMNWANMATLPVKMESRSADAFTTFEDAGMTLHFSEKDK